MKKTTNKKATKLPKVSMPSITEPTKPSATFPHSWSRAAEIGTKFTRRILNADKNLAEETETGVITLYLDKTYEVSWYKGKNYLSGKTFTAKELNQWFHAGHLQDLVRCQGAAQR